VTAITTAAPQRAALARRIPWTLIVFLAAAAVPWLGSRYNVFLAEQIAIDALFAVSLNLLLGSTGLVSFGHVAYFGVGAYVCGILMKPTTCRSSSPSRRRGSARRCSRSSPGFSACASSSSISRC